MTIEKDSNQTPQYLTYSGQFGDAQIAYFFQPFKAVNAAKTPTIMFCGGFNSNMQGNKARFLEAFCRDKKLNYLRFDYQGHGQSSGEFRDGTIGQWAKDAEMILEHVTNQLLPQKDSPIILVGSSMGGWISLLLSQRHPHLVKGLVLLAPAPDFPTKLMWAAFDRDIKNILETEGVWFRPSEFEGEESYPITLNFINESTSHNLLDDTIPFDGPIHIIHGDKDEVVPLSHIFQLVNKLENPDTTTEIVKGGDHRLSTNPELNRLGRRVLEVIEKIS
ncbi:MAG: alpha/beta hydrolase [Alphaproteobacteria bacterium]|nr:alpha/beta hydrolase [Alphaproteobacteria bacterium]